VRRRESVEAISNRDGETEDMLPARGLQSPPSIHTVNRRPLGVGPVSLLGGVLLAIVIVALILLVSGSWVAGVVLLAAALVLVALLLVALEHEPDDPAARLANVAAQRAGEHTRVVGAAARAWSRAGFVVLRVAQRRYRLRWQMRRQLEPLGEAAYRGEEDRLEQLKARARQVEIALHEAEREAERAVDAAREEVERERRPVQATEILPIVEPAEPLRAPPDGGSETGAPAPKPPAPEPVNRRSAPR